MPWRFWGSNRRGTQAKAQSKNPDLSGNLATENNTAESIGKTAVPWLRLPFTVTDRTKKKTKIQPSEREVGPTGLHILHASEDPRVDLIFVHGLRGGSVKTWQKSGNPSLFWPKEWLPAEPGLSSVNIHSFGYDSDWTSQKSNILNIHDFGQTLFEEMRNSKHLRSDEGRPIIMLGHSMGGLVIKKAFILAQEAEEWRERIKRVFFLATPHRGSNYAAILSNILSVSGVMTTRQYIDELSKSSATLEQINSSFRQCAQSLTIFSFYETMRTKIGFSSLLIVEKDSAVLGNGFPNERVQYTDASHCDISKYYDPTDPTYISIRNALSSATQDLIHYVAEKDKVIFEKERKLLGSYFDVNHHPMEEPCDVLEGTCRWLERRKDFQEWLTPGKETKASKQLEPDRSTIAVYWLQARPGVGKTFVAAHVRNMLRSENCHTAHYQFNAQDRRSRSLYSCLKSLAYQIVMQNTELRRELCEFTKSSHALDLDSASLLWTTIFEKRIFQSEIQQPLYLVIDALDECLEWREFLTNVQQLRGSFRLRLFLTTRSSGCNQNWEDQSYSGGSLTFLSMPYSDTLNDIGLYVKSTIYTMGIVETASAGQLTEEIVSKSNGNFAWVKSVLRSLGQTHTKGERTAVMDRLPMGMQTYYEQCLQPVIENSLEIATSKSALSWIVAAKNNLSVRQLRQAVSHDIGVTLLDSPEAVEGICGTLVAQKATTQTLELIHPTVRDFFLTSAGELTVDLYRTHERIALILLQLLSSHELKPPRNARFLEKPRPVLSPLLDYAVEYFSDHVYESHSHSLTILRVLDDFSRTNSLCWIERVSMSGSLKTLLRTSKNLMGYIQRLNSVEPMFQGHGEHLRCWAMDVHRLATHFAEPLLSQPASIYYSLPPLCPSFSATFQNFGQNLEFPTTEGDKRDTWGDCIISFSLGEESPSSISCGPSTFAVGMESGTVSLYDQRSHRQQAVMYHDSPIDIVHVSGTAILTATTSMITMYDVDGTLIWRNKIRIRCVDIIQLENEVAAFTMHGHLVKWEATTGVLAADMAFPYQKQGAEPDERGPIQKVPENVSLSASTCMAALGYRDGTLCLWDLKDGDFVGWAKEKQDAHIAGLLFNPIPEEQLLLAVYTTHAMSLFNTWSGELVHSKPQAKNCLVTALCAAPDGTKFATTDNMGALSIWDFQNLSHLSSISIPTACFRLLNFSSDGASIFEAVDGGMRVWSPVALTGMEGCTESSIDGYTTQLLQVRTFDECKATRITATSASPNAVSVVIASRKNGEVFTIDPSKSCKKVSLYSHGNTVTRLHMSVDNVIASADDCGLVLLHQYQPTTGLARPLNRLGSLQVAAVVRQFCFSVNGEYLLVASTTSDAVYRIVDGCCIGVSEADEGGNDNCRRWMPDARCGQNFWLITNGRLDQFSAAKFPEKISSSKLHLQCGMGERYKPTSVDAAAFEPLSDVLVLEVCYAMNFTFPTYVFLFSIDNLETSSTYGEYNLISTPEMSYQMAHFLGYSVSGEHLFFFTRDSWIASATISDLLKGSYTRHLFLPRNMLSDVLQPIMVGDKVVVCHEDKVININGGLKIRYQTKFAVRDPAKNNITQAGGL